MRLVNELGRSCNKCMRVPRAGLPFGSQLKIMLNMLKCFINGLQNISPLQEAFCRLNGEASS